MSSTNWAHFFLIGALNLIDVSIARGLMAAVVHKKLKAANSFYTLALPLINEVECIKPNYNSDKNPAQNWNSVVITF